MVILQIQRNIRQKIDNIKIVNLTNISYISNSYQGILGSIDTRFFTASFRILAYRPSGQLGSKLQHIIIAFQKNKNPQTKFVCGFSVSFLFVKTAYLLHSSKRPKYGIFKHFVSYLLLTHKYSYDLILSYSVHSRYDLYLSKQS